tara:strand:+ start:9140 stop:10294 length:1155 start_codon:yes stop_codon:yes gene_type:complete
MKKICVVITARPSYSRIKTVLHSIKNSEKLELQIVLGASALLERYGPVIDIIKQDGFVPNEIVHMVLEGGDLSTSAKSTGLGIIELASTFKNLNPDMVLTVADRYETMATAIAAAYSNIPLAHVQGGEITGSIDEKVRHAVTKLSDIHFVSTELAKTRLIKMGESADYVFTTGCPSIDIVKQVMSNPISNQFNPFEFYGGVGDKFDTKDGYIVVLQHPVTTEFSDSRYQIEQTMKAINKMNYPTFWFWPNVDAGSDNISKSLRLNREQNKLKSVYFLKNLSPEDFIKLLLNAKCLVGNSSVGIRECSYIGTPVINIGNRQLGRERGNNVTDVDYVAEDILNAMTKQISKSSYPSNDLYGDGFAGKKISDLLESQNPSINKKLSY